MTNDKWLRRLPIILMVIALNCWAILPVSAAENTGLLPLRPSQQIEGMARYEVLESHNIGYIACPKGFTTEFVRIDYDNGSNRDYLEKVATAADCHFDIPGEADFSRSLRRCNRCIRNLTSGTDFIGWPNRGTRSILDYPDFYPPLFSHRSINRYNYIDPSTSHPISDSRFRVSVAEPISLYQPPTAVPVDVDHLMAKSKNVGYVACPLGFTTRYRDSYADKEKLADCDDNGRCNRCVKTFYGRDIYELTDKDKWPHNNYCTDDEFPPLTKPSDVQLSGGCARKEKRYSWSEEDWIWIVDPMPLDFWSSDIIPGYNQINIYWQGTRYSYYQLKNQPNLVFYLPDRFELIKPEDDTVPDRSKLKFTTPDGSLDNLKATFSFFAKAVVDGDRIDDAKAQIANQIGEEPEMLIFQADKNFRSQLTLRLPNLEGTASQPQVRETAQIDIESGFEDELDLAFPAFQALWNAIFSDGSDTVLFTGDVETKINDGFYKDQIDFIGRFAPEDMEEYYYSIIDSGTDTTYSKALNATTFAEVFDAPPSGTDGQIETLNLDFGENSANLSPSNLEDEIELQRPISDLILGNEDPDVYRYTLKVMRENACNSCAKTANADWIYINQNDTENCQDNCS